METTHYQVVKLQLDLKNYRTMPQSDDVSAIHAMIALEPEYFWGLTSSLLEDGYIPTEAIVALETSASGALVMEGNRRVAALKILLGQIQTDVLSVPGGILKQIKSVSPSWKKTNKTVPCLLFKEVERKTAKKLVSRIHGGRQKASRLPWNPVAKARFNREENGRAEYGLNLLEAYLREGKNVTGSHREKWASDYPLTVLNDVIPKIASASGLSSATFVANYPRIEKRNELETLLYRIGQEEIGFNEIRHPDMVFNYGLATRQAPPVPLGNASPTSKPVGSPSAPTAKLKPRATSLDDPRSVYKCLKRFTPRGHSREKLVFVLEEARRLRLDKHPLSFCFLIRAMFELSAKAYCADHKSSGLSITKPDGSDRKLKDVLTDIGNHLTNNMKGNHPNTRIVQPALSELNDSKSLISLTAMNQTVHSKTFSLDEHHVSRRFHNVFPLLELLNS